MRVNGISCAEVKRYIVGPAGTKVELVFASKRDNKNITVQDAEDKGTEVEFTPEINPERDRSDGGRERDRGRGRSPRQEI